MFTIAIVILCSHNSNSTARKDKKNKEEEEEEEEKKQRKNTFVNSQNQIRSEVILNQRRSMLSLYKLILSFI